MLISETKSFTGTRVVVRTPRSFDSLLQRLRHVMGKASIDDINALAREQPSEDAFARLVEERYVGTSGFMFFTEINHGAWLPRYGITQRVVRWIIGNPLYAITMIRHDITAGLFAPVELLITEDVNGGGSIVTYVRPSSLMVVEDNPQLLKAAVALDAKLAALVDGATG